ncbi:MAG TPA: peptide chain release factor N(5)-glutamine methyltransferase [Thermoanaerobaculia bacterium]|nr:peptide chain release factor N(5)-glutamine methyltransferase [Thermoanaerobaculia bacterium]
MNTVDELLRDARARLAAAPFAPPTREAALLLGRVLGWSEAEVLARGERRVEETAAARFAELLARRLGGEPVAYLFAEREFYGRAFHVDRRVLIPRPESEHLVEAALARLRRHRHKARRILDVGTGSGCLAVTLALELPEAAVVATDLSPAALAVAASNARRHAVAGRVRLAACDLLAGLDAGAFDLAVSNPPYVGRGEAPALSREVVDFEPAAALFADDEGEDAGIAAYSHLFAQAAALAPGAWLLVEIGHGQLAAVRRRAAASGLQVEGVVEDYAGIPRVVELRRP